MRCLDGDPLPINQTRSDLLDVLRVRVAQKLPISILRSASLMAGVERCARREANRYRTVLGPCVARAIVQPCNRCGHARTDHDFEDGCLECHECSGWRAPGPAWHTALSTQAACSDVCTCGQEMCGAGYVDGAQYIVTAVRVEPNGRTLLGWVSVLGPYATHSAALSMVDRALGMAERIDPVGAHRMSFGTARWIGNECPIGRLNDDLAREDRETAERATEEQPKPKRRTRRAA